MRITEDTAKVLAVSSLIAEEKNTHLIRDTILFAALLTVLSEIPLSFKTLITLLLGMSPQLSSSFNILSALADFPFPSSCSCESSFDSMLQAPSICSPNSFVNMNHA